MLEGNGADGARGLKMMSDAGYTVLMQQPTVAPERIDAARGNGVAGEPLDPASFATRLLELTGSTSAPALAA